MKINRCANGYLIHDKERTFVFADDLRGQRDLLVHIAEDLGMFGSKHDPERIVIEIRQGESYVEPLP